MCLTSWKQWTGRRDRKVGVLPDKVVETELHVTERTVNVEVDGSEQDSDGLVRFYLF